MVDFANQLNWLRVWCPLREGPEMMELGRKQRIRIRRRPVWKFARADRVREFYERPDCNLKIVSDCITKQLSIRRRKVIKWARWHNCRSPRFGVESRRALRRGADVHRGDVHRPFRQESLRLYDQAMRRSS